MTLKMLWKLRSVLRWQAVCNILKLRCSYMLSRILKKTWLWGLPLGLSVEPTTSCNLSCKECPTGQKSLLRPKGKLSWAMYKKLIDELGGKLFYLIFYFQGEPLLHPGFFRFVHYASQKDIYTLSSTNGHYLTQENINKLIGSGLHRLIVSVDGCDQASYEQYRQGGNLETVLQGIRLLQHTKKIRKSVFPEVIMQFLVFRNNEDQIERMQYLAKDLGVELTLKSAQIYNYRQAYGLVPQNAKYARYRIDKTGQYVIKSTLPNRCWRMWSSAVVTWDGRVLPCCFDKDAHHQQGMFQQAGFSKIWHSVGYNAFREKILHARKQLDICKNCTEGLRL